MRMDRTLKLALVSLLFNMMYSAYHIIFGIATHSWWFFTIGIYYAILSIVRFVVLRHKGNKHFVIRFTGIMLMVLSLSLVGTVILAFVKDRGTEFHLIVMLAIAVYAFTKITLATITIQRGTLDQPNLKSKAAITNPKRKIKAENFTTPC